MWDVKHAGVEVEMGVSPMTHFDRDMRAYLWPPQATLSGHLVKGLRQKGFTPFDTGHLDVLGFYCEPLSDFADALAELLSPSQRLSTRALLFTGGTPGLSDFGMVNSVACLLAGHSNKWINELLEAKRYKSLMQPIVTPAGQVHGYEFLFRGLHPDGSVVPPDQIFGAAHDLRLARRIDHAAGSNAFSTADKHDLDTKLFINVLPHTIAAENAGFATRWAEAADAQIKPENIVFELVESQVTEDPSILEPLAKSLRDEGFKIALDDFGAGFNNLTMIPKLQPDYIKLDKALVQRVDSDARTWTLVANMVDAAKQNDIAVIAEGVEGPVTAQTLDSMGCDYLQGFHYGAPQEGPWLG